MSHSIAPWKKRNISGRLYVVDAENKTVCCLTEKRGMDWQKKEEKRANSVLIEYAPTMLKALQAAVNHENATWKNPNVLDSILTMIADLERHGVL